MAADTMSARWSVEDTDAASTLRIALWNGHGVTVLYPKDGGSPWVCLWAKDDELELDRTTLLSFRGWLDRAQGKRA